MRFWLFERNIEKSYTIETELFQKKYEKKFRKNLPYGVTIKIASEMKFNEKYWKETFLL